MLHSRLRQPTCGVETEYCKSPGTLPEVCRQTSLTSAPVENRWPSLCQSEILPYYPTIKETLWEEPGSIWNNRNPWLTLVHSLPTPTFPLHPPCFPHIPIRTGGTGAIPTTHPTPTTSCRDQWQYQVWSQWGPWLKGGQMFQGKQVTLLPSPLDWIWGHRRRNIMDIHPRPRAHSGHD